MSEIIKSIEDTGSGFKIITNLQVIEVGIEMEQSCCEEPGYFICNDSFDDFIGADLVDISLVDEELNTRIFNTHVGGGSLDEGDVMFVNFETSRGTLQFVVYNAHNGYYGHGAWVISEKLNHRECL